MIKIFNSTEIIFTSNGEEVISEYSLIETKKKSLNGWYIDVECPIKHKDLIVQDNLAVVKTKSKLKLQAFRIDNIKYTSTKIKFTANHVMFDAHRYFLLDVRPTNSSAINALEYTSERTDTPNPFKYTSNVNSSSTAYFIRKSLFEAWAVIEERWEGVFDADNFDITFNNEKVIDRGATLNYGVDLEGIEVYEDWSGVVTRLYPTGFDGIMLPEKMLISKQQYEQPYSKTIHFDTEFEEEDRTPENLIPELRKNAIKYIDINQYPMVSYTVKSDINQDLEIGDMVVVKHPYLNIETQVQEYTYDVINNRVKALTFGNFSRDVKTKFGEIKDMISQNKNKLSNVEALVHDQTNLINSLNKNGYVYIDDNEILIVDKLPKEQAKNVWRFGLGGLGFSSSGYEGPFDYAFTQDGKFNASFIAAGSIVTNQLAADVGSSLDISSNKSIKMLVENLSEGNLILNLNARLDIVNNTYPYYYFNQNGLQTVFQTIKQTRHAGSPIFVVVPDRNSVSGFSKEYRYKGKALATSYAYIVPDTVYSYRCKRTKGSTPMDIYVVEYDGAKKQIKRTKFTLDGQNMIETFSFTPAQMTMWARLEFYVNEIGVDKFTDFEQGTIKTGVSEGETLEDIKSSVPNNRMRSNSLINISEGQGITIPDGYEAIAYYFDSSQKAVGVNTGWTSNWISSRGYHWCALLVRKADGSDFSTFEGVITYEGFRIAEEMFVRGEPAKWQEDANEVKVWAQSQFTMVDDTILMEAKRIDSLNNDIHNAGLEINAIEGITVWGKKLSVWNEQKTKEIMGVSTISGKEQMYINGVFTSGDDSNQLRLKDGRIEQKLWDDSDFEPVIWFQKGSTYISGRPDSFGHGNIWIGVKETSDAFYKSYLVVDPEQASLNGEKSAYLGSNEGDASINGGSGVDLHSNKGNINLRTAKGWIQNANDGNIILSNDKFILNISPPDARDRLLIRTQANGNGIFIDNNGGLMPFTNNYPINLGWTDKRWESVYLQNQPNVSSDKRYKYNIHDFDPLLLDSFEELQGKGFTTKHDDKFSFGYIAQDVERCLFKYVTKVWGFKDANEWMPKFKLLCQSESYKSLLYAEVQVIMMAVERRHRERLEDENKQLRREFDSLIEILKEKGVI